MFNSSLGHDRGRRARRRQTFQPSADVVKILALETTGTAGSAALLEDQRVVAQQTLPPTRRTAQTLAPAIRDLLADAKWRPGDVRLVAVAQGPGSFTGLRIGVTTAKAFAYAIGAEILGVDTLEAVAARAPTSCQRIDVVLDAQRKEVFAGRFRRDESGVFRGETATRIIGVEDWLQLLDASVCVSGPALVKLAAALPPGVTPTPAELWAPRAEEVGRLALRRYEAGARDDVWKLAPLYLRQSAAEEKWAQRQSEPSANGG